MADKHPFWSLCVSDFFGSRTCASMTGLQQAVYLLSLARCWEWDGLPADPEELRIALQLSKPWWNKNAKVVMGPYINSDDKLRHPRQELQRRILSQIKTVRSVAGTKGGIASGETRRKTKQTSSTHEAKRTHPSPSPSPSEDEEKSLSSFRKPKRRKKYPSAFEDFWKSCPTRNGIRAGKGATFTKWDKLTPEDQELVVKAVEIYSRSDEVQDGFAKDPERFLKSDYWHDWLEESAGSVEDNSGKWTEERYQRLMAHVQKERDEREEKTNPGGS